MQYTKISHKIRPYSFCVYQKCVKWQTCVLKIKLYFHVFVFHKNGPITLTLPLNVDRIMLLSILYGCQILNTM